MTKEQPSTMVNDDRHKVAKLGQSKRQAVVIMGMHRSGTSALSRVLNMLGCEMPKTLVGGDAHNESGYWESSAVKALDDKILESGGSGWKDWRRFNQNWLKTPRADEFFEQAVEVLREEYGTAGMFVFKDPRVCRLVPFWRTVFDSLNLAMKVIIPIRNPLEVSDSLRARNGIPEAVTLLLWLRHVLEAEFETRGMNRHVIQYSNLLEDWTRALEPAQKSLDLYWPRFSTSVKSEISSFLTEELRHNRRDIAAVGHSPLYGQWLETVYNVLCDWSATGEKKEDFQRLDAVRQALDELPPSVGYMVDQIDAISQAMIVKDREIGFLRGEAGKRGDRLDELTEELRGERSKLDEALESGSRIAGLENAIAEATRELESLRSETERLRSEVAEAQRINERLSEEIAAREGAVQQLRGECTTAREEVGQLQIEGSGLKRELSVLMEVNKIKSEEVSILTKMMCDREAQIANDSVRLSTLQADVEVGCRVIDTILDKIVRKRKGPAGLARLLLKQQVQRLQKSGLFDADWYLAAYPDVQEAGVDPAIHYLRHGYCEDRDPSIDVRLMRRSRASAAEGACD